MLMRAIQAEAMKQQDPTVANWGGQQQGSTSYTTVSYPAPSGGVTYSGQNLVSLMSIGNKE